MLARHNSALAAKNKIREISVNEWLIFFLKKVGNILNIPAMLGIILTIIENLECKIGEFEVLSLWSVICHLSSIASPKGCINV